MHTTLGVKSEFPYAHLDEELYVSQPQGFASSENANGVYHVQKALYGLNQASRAWSMQLPPFCYP